MASPLPKPPERRQRRKRPTLVPIDSAPRVVPTPPTGLLAATVASWSRLWQSPVAVTFSPDSDGPAIERLFLLRDERARASKVAAGERIVEGSKGQPVLNPLLNYIQALDAEIRALEDRFGLNPRGRLANGIALGEAHRSLAELNAAFLEGSDADD